MSNTLDDLAQSYGIQLRYKSETGEDVAISDQAKRSLLQIMRVDPGSAPRGLFKDEVPEISRSCILPSVSAGARLWGVTCQLYALRSARNLGIGDFEDLGRLAEFVAQLGGAFLGVNPLHALFLSDPGRTSPYSPSTRRYLNPLYIAVDGIEGGSRAQLRLREAEPDLFAGLDTALVDYAAATSVKLKLLRAMFGEADRSPGGAFETFCAEGGDELRSFAVFEAISQHEVAAGGAAGWNRWPGDMQRRDSEAVRRFESEHAEEVQFHLWLQFIANQQLAQANARAKQAGMQIGLYLDFAVGVAPDGAETWADPDLAVRDARVGSPPDLFNSEGQDWGLAPLAPQVLAERSYKPLFDAYVALMKHSGAVRIDHAMGLSRLWWVPASGKPQDGGFVRYPFKAMLDTLAAASEQTGTVVIGEDLGTVPEGFREVANKAGILSYRVLYFEKDDQGAFLPPDMYPEHSLATISTHDLATLSGWWKGNDIELRAATGRQSEDDTRAALDERKRDRIELLRALREAGLLHDRFSAAITGEEDLPEHLDEELLCSVHRFGARTKALLFAVQLDDMLMAEKQANLPGTTSEYPNWSIRSTCLLEDLASNPTLNSIAEAVNEERQN